MEKNINLSDYELNDTAQIDERFTLVEEAQAAPEKKSGIVGKILWRAGGAVLVTAMGVVGIDTVAKYAGVSPSEVLAQASRFDLSKLDSVGLNPNYTRGSQEPMFLETIDNPNKFDGCEGLNAENAHLNGSSQIYPNGAVGNPTLSAFTYQGENGRVCHITETDGSRMRTESWGE